jgi:hypothetical protein
MHLFPIAENAGGKRLGGRRLEVLQMEVLQNRRLSAGVTRSQTGAGFESCPGNPDRSTRSVWQRSGTAADPCHQLCFQALRQGMAEAFGSE